MAISPAKAVRTVARVARRAALPACVLLAGWTLSGTLYSWMTRERMRYDDSRRDSIVAGVETDLRIRLEIFENVLRGAAADLMSSDHLTNPEDWHTYVEQTGLFARYPGTAVMAVIQPVPRAHLEDFITEQRHKGSRDFKIRVPTGAAPSAAPPIDYLIMICAEPPRIAAQALGSDLNLLPRRRAAAERARDDAVPVLVSDALQNGAGSGLQLFVPVYRKGSLVTTASERRAALTAWVMVGFSADAFFRSAMRGREEFMDLQAFEETVAPGNLMFSSNGAIGSARGFERTTSLALDGSTWVLGWSRTVRFPVVSKTTSIWAAGSCAAMTLLVAGLVFRLQSTVQRTETKLAIEQKQAEQTQAFLASLVQSSDDSIVGTTIDGFIVSWNRGSEQLWGYTADEAIGKHIRMLYLPERRQDYQKVLERVNRNEHVERFESVRIKKDGTLIDVSVILSPIKDTNGQLVGASAIYSDITQRKQAEAELLRAKEAAEAASLAKSQFLANMSHEIRTPMNGVLGMTELALGTELDPEQHDYLTTARNSAEALLAVINDILDFSKIEAGMLDLNLAEFQLRESIEETMKALALSADQKGLELVCDIRSSVPDAVRGDALRIRQVLMNLVGNAVKFTERGEVAVTLDAKPTADAGLGTLELHFAVRDTGIGIARAKQEMVFAAFTQADNSTTRHFGGTGLGLSISKRLVEMMGGRIWLESEPGRGSTFSFTVRATAVESQSAAIPAASTSLSGQQVLIVDDNATNRTLLARWLSQWGLQPILAESAMAALKILQSSEAPIPLVLTDVHMPEMDGFELVRRIKSGVQTTSVIMLSSCRSPGEVARGSELGLEGYLVKPVRRKELLQMVLRALSAHAAAQSISAGEGGDQAVDRKPALGASRRLRILVVEDNAVNQKLALALLKKQGHSAVAVGSGREAIAALDQESFDMVLMDVQLPEMDGFEATRKIRAREQFGARRIPIIAMTAHAMSGDREQCLAAGMDGYVSKPISVSQLLRAIASFSHAVDEKREATQQSEVAH